MRKKNKNRIFVLAVFLVLLFVGTTLANLWTMVNLKEDITIGNVDLELHVTDKNGNPVAEAQVPELLPGRFIDYHVSTSNIGDYDIYCRIIVTKDIADEIGQIDRESDAGELKFAVKKSAIDNWYVDGYDPKSAKTITLGNVEYVILPDAQGNQKNFTAYYRKILHPGEYTSNITDYLVLGDEASNSNLGKNSNIKVDAQAIQAVSAEEAIKTEWGKTVQFDEKGRIINIQ